MSLFKPNQTNQIPSQNKSQNNLFTFKLIAGFSVLLLLTTGFIYFKKTDQSSENQGVKLEEVSLTQEQKLTELARLITVKIISGSNGGSGVLIKKKGDIYTVLTNHHVVQDNEQSQVVTPDGKIHEAKLLNIDFENKDIALLEFQSTENYQIASLSNLANTDTGNQVFSAGFPFRENDTHNREFALKQGRISLVLPRHFRGGYQVGYINDVEKGMSGGPVLNSEGKVIAINGIHSHPLWGNPYIYEDDTSPSDILRQRLERSSWGVPVETLAEFAPDLLPELSIAQSPANNISTTELAEKIDRIAEQISVKIQWQGSNGSGVIIARDGNTYSVLTAEHVASGDRTFTIYTPDGKKYSVDNSKIKTWDNVDLAIIQFTSEEDYQVAKLGNYSLDSQDQVIFVTGWPNRLRSDDRQGRKFSVGFNIAGGGSGETTLDNRSLSQGRELIYTNITETGMSGGAVLDTNGRLIGIHSATEGVKGDQPSPIPQRGRDERKLDIGFSLGIPVRTFIGLMRNENARLNWQKETNPPIKLTPAQQDTIVSDSLALAMPDDNADEVDWLNYGNKLWRALRFEQAQKAFERAIDIDPNFFEAWYGHGLALKSQGEWQKAVSSFQKVVESRPSNNSSIPRWYNFAVYAHRQQAICFSELLQPQKSLAALNQAIAMRPDDFTLYNSQAQIFALLGRYEEALNAVNKSIELSKGQNPYPYIRKAEVMNLLLIFEDERIIPNYTKAIQVQPSLAVVHGLRGTAISGNYVQAIQDINTAIELNPDNAVFYAQRGLIYGKVGNKQQFEENFEQAIKLEPDNPIIYSLRGEARGYLLSVLKEKGETINPEKTQQAIIDDYTEAIRLAPESAGFLYLNLSNSIGIAGYQKESVSFLEKAEQYLSNKDLAIFSAQQGFALYLSGNEAKANEAFTKARELEPNNDLIDLVKYRSYVRKMNEYYQMGDREKGDEELKKAIDLANQTIKQHPQLAFRFYEENALAYFTRENTKPEDATKDYSQSIESLTKAIETSNNDYDKAYLYYKRASGYRLQGNYELAIADINQAIKLESEANPAYYNLRGNIYYDNKEYQKAIEDYTKAIEINPNEPQYHENRFLARYNLGDYDKKFGGLQKYLSSINKQLNQESAPLFIDLNDFQRLEALNNTLLYPDNVEYHNQLAKTHKDLAFTYAYYAKDYESAFESLNQLAVIYPDNPILLESYKLIGQSAINNQHWEEAIIALEKIRKIDPDSLSLIEGYNNFAKGAWLRKNHQYEIIGFQKLVEIESHNPENYRNLGQAYFRNQEYEKAIKAYTQAIELNPNGVDYYGLRADAYEAMGNHQLYKKDIQKARQLSSDSASKFYLKILQFTP